ncbi:hypothetical protein [Streptomyces sp. NPDC006691]|uniref:hypothetical protein n=1 Tax=Streptomyces sp. NPDC006691 TaxID=3364757 RepID=UPI003683EA6E
MAIGAIIFFGVYVLLALIAGIAFSFLKKEDGSRGCLLGLFVAGILLLVPALIFGLPIAAKVFWSN